jgi:hypothetical protein
MRAILLILVVLGMCGCAGASTAPSGQPISTPSPPQACIDTFSGRIARQCL